MIITSFHVSLGHLKPFETGFATVIPLDFVGILFKKQI